MNSKNAGNLAEAILDTINNYSCEITYLEVFNALERVKSRMTDKLCENTIMADVRVITNKQNNDIEINQGNN